MNNIHNNPFDYKIVELEGLRGKVFTFLCKDCRVEFGEDEDDEKELRQEILRFKGKFDRYISDVLPYRYQTRWTRNARFYAVLTVEMAEELLEDLKYCRYSL